MTRFIMSLERSGGIGCLCFPKMLIQEILWYKKAPACTIENTCPSCKKSYSTLIVKLK